MRNPSSMRYRRSGFLPPPLNLADELRQRLVGQDAAVDLIVPFVEMYQAGLSPEGRPAGVFLLLGPSGTGKTRTVEALADVLHGSDKHLLRIDCGEFQMDHEVAKLIGAPPGYLGHRETQPLLNQARVNAVASDRSGLSLVLFDEIEKAAPSLARLLLGVLDKGTLRLGDNNTVHFDRCLIFMTSNLGAEAMMREFQPTWGFPREVDHEAASNKVGAITKEAMKRRFSPEFINRIDGVATYRPLDQAAMDRILDLQLELLQKHLDLRLGLRAFVLEVKPAARQFLLQRGISLEYGARELKRVIQKFLLQPLSSMIVSGRIAPGAIVRVNHSEKADQLTFHQRLPDIEQRAA